MIAIPAPRRFFAVVADAVVSGVVVAIVAAVVVAVVFVLVSAAVVINLVSLNIDRSLKMSFPISKEKDLSKNLTRFFFPSDEWVKLLNARTRFEPRLLGPFKELMRDKKAIRHESCLKE